MFKRLILFFLLFLFAYSKPVFAANEIKVLSITISPKQGLEYTSLKNKVNTLNNNAAKFLSEATRYKGYKVDSPPYLKYTIIDSKYYNEVPKTQPNNKYLNYTYYLKKENICDLVDKNQVKQIWIYTDHNSNIVPVESNMAMGTKSSKYFNKGNYGDVSNSYRTNDLPVCKNTYTVFGYNYNRGVPEILEDHTHQIEHLMNFIDGRGTTIKADWGDLLFWGKFVGSDQDGKILKPGCGWTHYPPNGTRDYDWYNTNPVLSDCEDWKPDGTSIKKLVSCKTWSKTEDCPVDGGLSFKIWWMQNLPGYNNGLYYNGRPLINWWDIVYDFDSVLANESGLYVPKENKPEENRFDVNRDSKVDVLDVIFLIKYIFGS